MGYYPGGTMLGQGRRVGWALWLEIFNSLGHHWPPVAPNIQAAINDLPVTGGKVWVPPGIFTRAGVAVASLQNLVDVTLQGAGKSTVLEGNLDVIDMLGDEGCLIKDMRVNGVGGVSPGNDAVDLDLCENCTVEDLWIYNARSTSVNFDDCIDCKMKKIYAEGSLEQAFRFGGATTHCQGDMLTARDCAGGLHFPGGNNNTLGLVNIIDPTAIAVLLDAASANEIAILDVVGGLADGIELITNSIGNIFGVIRVYNCAGYGLDIAAGSNLNTFGIGRIFGNALGQVRDLGTDNDVAHIRLI